MVLFNFLFSFLYDPFYCPLILAVVFEAIDSDGPLIVVESALGIIVSDDGINSVVNDSIGLPGFVPARFIGVTWF